MDVQVHETAVIDDGAEIGAGTRVWHFVHVSAGATIGRDCVLGQNVFIDRDVLVGDRTRIQNNVAVYAGVEVAAEVFLGPSCVFTNVINPRAFVERKHEFRRTRVGRGATVGANATVVCGNELGEYCLVGAGAVVTRDVPAYALVVGNPARQVGWVCRCGVKLTDLSAEVTPGALCLACDACGAAYEVEADACRPCS